MELIIAILVAGPLGYFVSPRRRSLIAYLTIWAVVFPIQTIVVHTANPDDIEPLYFIVNALILCLGIGLNYAGAEVRRRRDAGVRVAS